MEYTSREIKKSNFIDRAILSTDSKIIADIGIKLGLEVPFLRPKKLAKDNTPSLPVFKHAICELYKNNNYIPDVIVILQTTSPLRTSKHIDEAIKKFLKSGADSLVSIVQIPHNMSPSSAMVLRENGDIKPYLDYDELMNIRQKKPIFYARNGAAIYIFTYDCIMNKNSLFGDRIIPYFMNKDSSFDLDDAIDLEIIKLMLTSRNKGK